MAKNELLIVARVQDMVSKRLVKIQTAAKRMGSAVVKQGLRMTKSMISLKGVLTGIGAIMAGKWAAGFTSSTADMLHRLDIVAQRSNVSIRALQEVAYAGESVGMSFDQVADALKDFQLRTGDAMRGTEAQVKMFRQFGIDIDRYAGQTVDMTDMLARFAAGMKNFGSEAEAARALQDGFGESSIRLLPLLKQGPEALRKYAAEAHHFGRVLGSDAIARSKEYMRALQRLSASFSGLKDEISVAVYPAITKVMDRLAYYIADRKGVLLGGAAKVAAMVTDAMAILAKGAGKLVEYLIKAGDKLGLTEVGSIKDKISDTVKQMNALDVAMSETLIKHSKWEKELETRKRWRPGGNFSAIETELRRLMEEHANLGRQYDDLYNKQQRLNGQLAKAKADRVFSWDDWSKSIDGVRSRIQALLGDIGVGKPGGDSGPVLGGSQQAQRVTKHVDQMTKAVDTLANEAAGTLESNMVSAFDSIVSGAERGKAAFSSMASSMLNQIASLIFRLGVLKPMMNSIFTPGAGGGGGAGALPTGGWGATPSLTTPLPVAQAGLAGPPVVFNVSLNAIDAKSLAGTLSQPAHANALAGIMADQMSRHAGFRKAVRGQ